MSIGFPNKARQLRHNQATLKMESIHQLAEFVENEILVRTRPSIYSSQRALVIDARARRKIGVKSFAIRDSIKI